MGPLFILYINKRFNMMVKNNLSILIRIFSYSILALTFVFLVNNVLTVWFDWPGVKKLFAHYELFGFKKFFIVPISLS